jgi:hypothetical protein
LTVLRIRYLQDAWNRLVFDAGSITAASELVDIWSIHSFILNEQEGQWGTGIPPGFENDHADAVIITDYADTYSISIFQERIIAFRLWMAGIGERDKPLWITEYGSLFPPIDPPDGPDFENVSDADTAQYMVDTFNFMLTASDHQSGMPADGNQLVQRWFWYSLNDNRYHFGGSIYNPDYPDDFGPLITQVGQYFIDYQGTHLVQPDLLPLNLVITPVGYSQDPSLVDYRLVATVGNNEFDDATCGNLWIYDGDPSDDGSLIVGPVPASAFLANYGTALITSYWNDVTPLTEHTLYVCVEPVVTPDTDPSNNCSSYEIYTQLPLMIHLPFVRK